MPYLPQQLSVKIISLWYGLHCRSVFQAVPAVKFIVNYLIYLLLIINAYYGERAWSIHCE